MTNPGQDKKYGPTDPVAASNVTEIDEALDVDDEEKDFIEINTSGGSSSHSGSEKEHIEKEKRPVLQQTKSYATTTSAVTRTESNVEQPKKRWYKKLNPLRWGGIPPVPETRQVCREYNAPFLSLVYFQWMAPLMSVSPSTLTERVNTNLRRLDTNGNSNKTTFGR
jgi:ATP-binding cassette subfamily C (CFTR/MRP) protein 1